MTGLDAGTRPLGRAARLPLLAPLANRDYRFVWLGESVSLLGDQFNTVALAWLVLGLTGSGFALGAILIAAAIPRGVFLLVGGVLSDRVSPRDLALASNVLRAILTTIVAALVIGERVELWHLAAVGVVFGTVDAVFLPAINTLVPRLVPSERLAAANAMLQGTGQLVGTIGPAVAGFAVALVGVGAAFAVDAASFAVAALMLWFVRSGATPGRGSDNGVPPGDATPDPEPPSLAPSMRASLVEGGRVVLGDPVMRSIVVLSTAANLAFTGATVVGLPWLALVRFGADAASLGLLFAAFGAGSLAGVVAAGSLPHPRRFGAIVLGFVLIMGIGLAAIGLAPTLPVAGAILVGIGAMNGWVNIVVIAWVQAKTDPVMLGRTMSFLMLGSVVAAPLSLALAAVIVDTNATALFLAAGLLVIASAAVALASGLHRRMV
jgi:predicted MFS family arabinose efflux permease